MDNKRSLLFFLLMFLALPCVVFSSLVDEYNSRITEYTLKNGMHFILLEDHTAPVISFHVHVKAGSKNEQIGETGISHLLEHLAFNGSTKIGTKNWKAEKQLMEKMDETYAQLKKSEGTGASEAECNKLRQLFVELKQKAASLSETNEFGKIFDMHGSVGPNAYTSYDMTAYWVELPSNKAELWALLESDRLFHPVFRGFYEEIEVVKEERRMRVDNSPWGKLMEEFLGVAYRLHPYRNPIVGYPADLEHINRSMIKDFYLTHYLPSNIIVTVTGDIYPETFIPLVERYFDRVSCRKGPVPEIPQEPPRYSEKRVVIQMDAQPMLLIGFNICDINHPDLPALEICSEILAGGRTSRLYKKLVKEEHTAISVGSWCWGGEYPGIFYLSAVASKDSDNNQIETSIYQVIDQLQEGHIEAIEISGAKARVKMELLRSLRARREMAAELAWYKAATGDWRNLFNYASQLEKVTAEDIVRVVKKYFTQSNRTVATIESLSKD